jgi:HlyD family secretion protein
VLEERLRQVGLQQDQAQLDSQGRVSQAEGELAVAQAELAKATADLEQNRADAQRYSELARKGAAPVQTAEQYATHVKTSEAQVEAARKRVTAAEGSKEIARSTLRNPEIRAAEKASLRGQWEEAKTQVQLARAESEQAAAALRKAEADVGDLTISAPFDGTVITRAAEPGQVVAAGTTILTIVDMSRLYLRGFVAEGQIGFVKVGQASQVFLDSAPDTPLAAEVMRVDPEAMFTPENTYFQEDRVKQVVGVKLLLKEGYGNVKLGMPADARILIAESRPGE